MVLWISRGPARIGQQRHQELRVQSGEPRDFLYIHGEQRQRGQTTGVRAQGMAGTL